MSTDAFQNLIDYVKQVKPYHTQLLDVVLEYACSETVAGSVSEQYSTEVVISTTPQAMLSRYGYGGSWDSSDVDQLAHPILTVVRRQDYTATFTPSSTTVAVSGIIDLIAGDEVVFETTSSPPTYSGGSIIGQVFHVLSVTSGGFICSLPTSPTVPVTWATSGSGTITAIVISRGVNTITTTLPPPSVVPVTVLSLFPAEVLMADPYAIVAANTSSNQFTISGNHITELVVGQQIYVRGNAFSLANKAYTVISTVLVSSNTVVSVLESIPGGTTSTGNLMIPSSTDNISVLPSGSQVKISNGGVTVGLDPDAAYYITPVSVGRFQLSPKLDPVANESFSKLTSFDLGDMTISSWITSPNGSKATVNGTLSNDGVYTVIDVSRTDNTLSVVVMPDLVSNESDIGTVSFGDNGFGSASVYDQPMANDEMRACGSVSDSIVFELI